MKPNFQGFDVGMICELGGKNYDHFILVLYIKYLSNFYCSINRNTDN